MLAFPPAALWHSLARFALLALAAAGANAAEPNQITWVLSDWAPNFIIRDGKPTTGQNDIYLKLIIARWPEAEHRFMVMSTARSTLELQRGSQLCRMNLIPTPERERFAFFTLTHLQLPLRLVVRKEAAAQAPRNEAGDVVLERLIQTPGLRGIAAAGRSYTAEVDHLLADRKSGSNIREIPNLPSNDGLFKLLELGRADYTLDYEPNFKYRDEQSWEHPLTSLPIAGTTLIPVGIACPRTRWGRMAVMKIDQLLSEAVSDPAYRQAQDRWLSPESAQRYRAELDRFYRQRARPADPARYSLAKP